MSSSIFRKFFFSYIIILIIPFFIGFLIYLNSINIMEEKAIAQYKGLLSKNKTLIESRLDEIHSIGEQINLNANVNKLLNTTSTNIDNNYIYYDAIKSISDYTLTNNLIDDFFVIMNTHDKVIAPNYAYTYKTFEKLYNFEMIPDVDISNTYFYKKFINVSSFSYKNSSKDVFFYLQSLPVGSLKNSTATFLTILNKKDFAKLLLPISLSNEETLYVLDSNNAVLFSSNDKVSATKIDGSFSSGSYIKEENKEFLICYEKGKNNFIYVAKIPKDMIFESFSSLKYLLIYTTIIFILLSFGVSYFFSNRNAKPLNTLIDKIDTLGLSEMNYEDNNEYILIQNALLHLSSENKSLQTTIKNQHPIIISNFYKQLFEGFFQTKNDYSNYLPFLNIEKNSTYAIEIIYIDILENKKSENSLKEMNIIKAIIKDKLKESPFLIQYTYDINESSFAILIKDYNQDKTYKNLLETMQLKIQKNILDEYNAHIYYAQSNTTDNLLDIRKLFNQGKTAIEWAKFDKSQIITYFSDIPMDIDNFYFPIELEIELISLIKSGSPKLLEEKLKILINENLGKRSLSREKTLQFINLLKGSILREFPLNKCEQNIKPIVNKLEKTTNIDEIYKLFIDIKSKYTDFIISSNEKVQLTLKNQIIDYINENYSNSDFSINDVANHFNRSETSIYQLFQKYFPVSFYSYLEEIRIKKACELIVDSNISVLEISYLVGYANDTSFRRAFKRNMNLTPTTYKKAMKKE